MNFFMPIPFTFSHFNEFFGRRPHNESHTLEEYTTSLQKALLEILNETVIKDKISFLEGISTQKYFQ